MNAALFKRYARAIIGRPGEEGRAWDGLRMKFAIESTPAKEPNSLTLEIFNLAPSSRDFLRESMRVELVAGYEQTETQVFKGEIRHISSAKEGADWITKLEAADGRAAHKATINKAFAPGITPAKMIEEVKKVMLGGSGGIVDGFTESLRALPAKLQGATLTGNAGDALGAALEPHGLEWSIQGERLQITKTGGATDEPVFVINSGSGMVGSPARIEGGGLEVTMLLNGNIRPGRAIKVESRDVNGFFVAQSVRHSGDTHGQEWYTIAEVKPL